MAKYKSEYQGRTTIDHYKLTKKTPWGWIIFWGLVVLGIIGSADGAQFDPSFLSSIGS